MTKIRDIRSGGMDIGIDIGGTNIKFGVVNKSGTIIKRLMIRTSASVHECICSIIDKVNELLNISNLSVNDIDSIGIGIPGTTDSRNGIVLFAPNLSWQNVKLKEAIKYHFDIPVYITQDTRAAAWGEYLSGAGRGMRDIACITLGTGIGCGLIINGHIYHGGLNTAGEFGHQIVEMNGNPCNCGRFGCLEAYAGGLAILKEAKKISNLEILLHKAVDDLSVFDVFMLSKAGYSEARRITDSIVKYLGIGMVNLINLNSPELISISGGISNAPDELLLNPLINFIENRAYSMASKKIKVVKSSLGDDAPLIGASMLSYE